jgi:type IX secretion system PorP/SprF family membrane protein
MKVKSLYLLPLICSLNILKAQDPAFSQFFASPLTLNPALTGKFNGALRVAGNYRDQWPTINNAFVTGTVSVDAPILGNKLPDNNMWGVGLMAMTDQTAGGALNSNYLSLSTSYHIPLDPDGYNSIGVGFQGTYASKILDGTKLHFEDQLDEQGGWTIQSQDAIAYKTVTINYFDVNIGALYNGSTTGANNFYLGGSIYHINSPKQSFLGDDSYTLHPRYTLHGGVAQPLGDGTSYVHFSGLYQYQAGAEEFVLGGAWSVMVNEDRDNPTNFYLGSWVRFSNLTDAIIPYVGLDYGNFSLGLTYDINISSLETASEARGGVEISLIYIAQKAGPKGVPCPRF